MNQILHIFGKIPINTWLLFYKQLNWIWKIIKQLLLAKK